jgi:hypothetical protein
MFWDRDCQGKWPIAFRPARDNALDWTNFHARAIAQTEAGDDMGHGISPFSSHADWYP